MNQALLFLLSLLPTVASQAPRPFLASALFVVKPWLVGMESPTLATSTTSGSTVKSPCMFWKTTEGCRRGAFCTFLHKTSGMEGRYFNYWSSSHLRRECTAKNSST